MIPCMEGIVFYSIPSKHHCLKCLCFESVMCIRVSLVLHVTSFMVMSFSLFEGSPTSVDIFPMGETRIPIYLWKALG